MQVCIDKYIGTLIIIVNCYNSWQGFTCGTPDEWSLKGILEAFQITLGGRNDSGKI